MQSQIRVFFDTYNLKFSQYLEEAIMAEENRNYRKLQNNFEPRKFLGKGSHPIYILIIHEVRGEKLLEKILQIEASAHVLSKNNFEDG